MDQYMNIQLETVDLLLNNDKGQLLKLYIYLRRFRRFNPVTKSIGGVSVIVGINQLDISVKQIAQYFNEPYGTIVSRLKKLAGLGLIDQKNIKNKTSLITVYDKPVKTGSHNLNHELNENISNTYQDTNNIVLNQYGIKNVYLSETELNLLIQEYGSENTFGIIQYLSDSKIKNNYQIKNDYKSLKEWASKAYFRRNISPKKDHASTEKGFLKHAK